MNSFRRVLSSLHIPPITKKATRLKLPFGPNTDHSIHAGLLVVEAKARRFDLWHKLRQLPSRAPRKDRRREGWFEHYGFIACDDGQTVTVRVGVRHHFKRDKNNCSARC